MKKLSGIRSKFLWLSAYSLVTVLASVQAQADLTTAHFEMTVIGNVAYGHQIRAGNNVSAINRIDINNIRPSDKFFATNNLCVAYTKTGNFEIAGEICNSAVNIISREGRVALSKKRSHRDYQAMAYSNRGVLRALSGDFRAAWEDFTTANELGSRLSAPEQNLGYLKVKESLSLTVR